MIYFMPIDECPRCGARTPRIFSHRCPKQEENGRVGGELAAEFQSWIASQLAASSARSGPSTLPRSISGAPSEASLTSARPRRAISSASLRNFAARADEL